MSEAWPLTKIGNCCDILDSMRVPLNAEERETMQGDIPYYGANGLQGYIDKYIFDEPLILLAEDGGYFDEYETRPIAYRISGKSWVNNHAHILRASANSSFCQDFIFYCLQHKNINPFIKGGTRAKLNQSELREILIPKAPESIQYRIAEILSTLDEAIEQTEALISKMQQVKAGLMHDLFTRGVTSDGRLRPTREQAPDLYKESPLGWIPREWEVARFGSRVDVIDPNPSHRYPEATATGIPICSTENFIGEDDYDFSKSKSMPEAVFTQQVLRCGFSPLDVVFARKGRIGLARRYGQEQKVFSHTVVIFKPTSGSVSREWILWLSRSHWLHSGIDLKMNSNLGVPTLGIAFIQAIEVPFPSPSEQIKVSEILDQIARLIASEIAKFSKLNQQKNGLVHDLLTGHVRVKTIEGQEVIQ